MMIIKRIKQVKKIIGLKRRQGKTIGFVPTMGSLHEGHVSLVRIAKKKSDFVVVSIFVNPTQFGPSEDFKRYPRDLKRDCRLLKKEGVDVVFFPPVKEIYPSGYKTYVEVTSLSNVLCGASRPGHFRGVTTVVLKLFNIIKPDIAVFGIKDFQQCAILKKMAKDLDLDIKILTGPTVREKDGLAMSSRNIYLSKTHRQNAAVLSQALRWAKKAVQAGVHDADGIIKKMTAMIQKKQGKIDYIETVDQDSLARVKKLQSNVLIVLAVYFGKTRLIDNIVV